jgi:hypothetical protein
MPQIISEPPPIVDLQPVSQLFSVDDFLSLPKNGEKIEATMTDVSESEIHRNVEESF